MGTLLERLLTKGGTATARIELTGPTRARLLVRTNPVHVTGFPNGTIERRKGHRTVSRPLARSDPIDYEMQWGPNTKPPVQDLHGIFDIFKVGSGYQIDWAFGGRLGDGQPRPEMILTTTEIKPDVYAGEGDNHFKFWATISLSESGNIDDRLDVDEDLRGRLGG